MPQKMEQIQYSAQQNEPISILREIEGKGLFRTERIVNARNGMEVEIDGKRLVNFCSNDYLGLSSHPRIIEAMHKAAITFGVGSSASPLVCGKTILHSLLEGRLAKVMKRDRVLLMSCGYMANLAIITALSFSRNQPVIEDRLCHASMVDGAKLAGVKLKRFAHASAESLEKVLSSVDSEFKLVLTESVFSMDGDIAPLPQLSIVCRKYQACLVVDDAHALGVLGDNGLGSMDHFSLGQSDVPLIMGTFGKALGVYGAFIAGDENLIEMLVQKARPYIYSTALPVPLVAAIDEALDIIEEESDRREALFDRVHHFRAGAANFGIKTVSANTPIQAVVIGDMNRTMRISKMLEEYGFFVSGIRPPTVPRNTSRLRITLSSAHSKEQIDHLLHCLNECMLALPV